jgi:hypothetical protein
MTSRVWNSWTLCAVVLSALMYLGFVQPAAAEPRKQVAVLSLESDMVTDDVAKGLRQAVCDALSARPDWAVHETSVSLAQLSFAHDCSPTEPACLRAITEQFKLDSLVFGRIARKDEEIVVHLSRFEPQVGAEEGSADATFARESVTPESLAWQGRALTSELFDAGSLSVAAAQSLQIDESDSAATPLVTKPTKKTAADSGISGRTVAGYALLGAAAVSTGLSVFSFVQIQNAQEDTGFNNYRRAVGRMQPEVQDVCAEVERGKTYDVMNSDFQRSKISCNRGRTYQLLQFVFLGSALITGGLGAYLLIDNSTERPQNRQRALQIEPRFSRSSAVVSAQWRF